MNLTDLHTAQIYQNMSKKKILIVVEEVCTGSGIRDAIAYELMQHCTECQVFGRDLGSDFVTHGDKKKLYENCRLDPQSLAAFVKEVG